MLLNMVIVPVNAEQTINSTDNIPMSVSAVAMNNKITISGSTESRNEYASVALLHKGKTAEDFDNMKNEQDFNLTVKSTQFVVSDNNRNFSASFDNTNGEFYGCVWIVTSTNKKATGVILGDCVKHIVFDDDKITVDGKADVQSVCILMLDSKGNEYKNVEANVANGEFTVEIPVEYNKASQLYVTDGINKISDCYSIAMPKKLYVSADGDDSNDGTKDSPFKTINAAKNAAQVFANNPVNIIVKSGEYELTDVTKFTAEDTRKVDSPLRIVGEGKVIFSGAKELPVSAFSHITDDVVKARMYESVRDKVMVMDLKAQGVSDDLINFITRRGVAAYRNSINPVRFYLNDEEQKLSRYPNEGYKRIKSVSNAGGTNANSTERAVFDVGEDVSRWETASDMFIEGEICQPWIAEWARVKSVNKNNVTLANYTYSVIKQNYKWAAVNLLEEIDIPGEYFIDSTTGMLYYYPPKTLTGNDKFEIAAYDKNVFEIDSCENLQFDGIDFEKLNNNAETTYYSQKANFVFIADNTQKLLIKNCEFKDIGGAVIRAWTNPYMITVDNCKLIRVARGLGNISGGSIVKLTDADFRVKNCEIAEWGRLAYIMPAIVFNGRGLKVTDTVFHDSGCMAISFGGQNVTISNNEFYEVCTELSDMGAVYTGRNWTTADVNICNNYFKNIGPKENVISNNAVCVYGDDAINNINIIGNIFVGRDNGRDDLNAIHYTQGPNVVMDGNTFVNFKYAVCATYRTRAAFQTVYPTLKQIPYQSAWYNIKYPYFTTLAAYNDNWDNKAYKENSSISGNVMIDTPNAKKYFSDDYHWGRNMDVEEKNNNSFDNTVLVNAATGDYRIKAEYAAGLSKSIKTTENSQMSDFGTKNRYLDFAAGTLYNALGNSPENLQSGENITVKDKVGGTDFDGSEVTYALAVYDGDGRLLKVATNKVKVHSDPKSQVVLTTTLPELGEKYTIKLIRLDSLSGLRPLSRSCVIFEK